MKEKNTTGKVFWLLLLAVSMALLTNRFSPKGIPLLGQWSESRQTVRAGADPLEPAAVRIIGDIDIAKQIYDAFETVFVDARPADEYRTGHIEGALSLPVWESGTELDAFISRYTPDQPIVVYCWGGNCEDGHELAIMLADLGFRDVSVMTGGLPLWAERGFPVAE